MRLCARAGQDPIAVSPTCSHPQRRADPRRRTNGAFDVTSGPLTHLWRRARRFSEVPATSRVTEAPALIRFRHLHLDASEADGHARHPRHGPRPRRPRQRATPRTKQSPSSNRTASTRALAALGGDVVVSAPPQIATAGPSTWPPSTSPARRTRTRHPSRCRRLHRRRRRTVADRQRRSLLRISSTRAPALAHDHPQQHHRHRVAAASTQTASIPQSPCSDQTRDSRSRKKPQAPPS